MSAENKCPTCGRRGTLRSEGGGKYRCSFCGAPALLMKQEETPEIREARHRLEGLKRTAPKRTASRRTTQNTVQRSPRVFKDFHGIVHTLSAGEKLLHGSGGVHWIEDAKGIRDVNGRYFILH